jgi:single-strand DNA-binding protein
MSPAARGIPLGSGLDVTAASINQLEEQPMPSKTNTSSTKATTENTETKRSSQGVSINRVTLVGRMVATPELRTTASGGVHVTTARIATNDREIPEYHDVVLWRQNAEFASTHMTKGRAVYVEGRLQSRTWEAPDGTKRRTVEVVAEKFQALSPKQAAEAAA